MLPTDINKLFEKILNEITTLSTKIDSALRHNPHVKTRSDELQDLFSALAEAQSEMPAVAGNKENPYFKERYIDLGDMITASRPSLTKFGLAVIQQILPNEDGQMILHTILSHSSGQWIESRIRIIPPKNDIRTMDSYVTYLRRCSYGSLIGIVGVNDDDDGEYASATDRDTFAKGTAINTKYNPKENQLETISRDQIEELQYELEGWSDISEMVLDGLRMKNIADMPKEKFRVSINKIRQIKSIRDGKK